MKTAQVYTLTFLVLFFSSYLLNPSLSLPSPSPPSPVSTSSVTDNSQFEDVASLSLWFQLALNRFENAFHNLLLVHNHSLQPRAMDSDDIQALTSLDQWHNDLSVYVTQRLMNIRSTISQLLDNHSAHYSAQSIYTPASQSFLHHIRETIVNEGRLNEWLSGVEAWIERASQLEVLQQQHLGQRIFEQPAERSFRRNLSNWLSEHFKQLQLVEQQLLKEQQSGSVEQHIEDDDDYSDATALKLDINDEDDASDINSISFPLSFSRFFLAKLCDFERSVQLVLSSQAPFEAAFRLLDDTRASADSAADYPATQYGVWSNFRQWIHNNFQNMRLNWNSMFNKQNSYVGPQAEQVAQVVRQSPFQGQFLQANAQQMNQRQEQNLKKSFGIQSMLDAEEAAQAYDNDSDSSEEQNRYRLIQVFQHFQQWFIEKTGKWPAQFKYFMTLIHESESVEEVELVRSAFAEWAQKQVQSIQSALKQLKKAQQ